MAADIAGAFPEGFYSTTNQRTEVRLGGHWIEVADQEMDCGIAVDPAGRTARCVAMSDVPPGDRFVVGHAGVRVFPERAIARAADVRVHGQHASRPKSPRAWPSARSPASWSSTRAAGGKTLLVGGPAIVHTGSGEHLCQLIREGYIDVLFAGNALATHDIEQALFGTSLGVYLDRGDLAEAGPRASPAGDQPHSPRRRHSPGRRDRACSPRGIMYECVRHDVDFLLAGSIRDDGPLPEVITDVLEAQRQMREKIRGVTFCLMIATTLHSIAVGNLLPAWVKVVCVDINPSTVIKLADRGSFQTVGLVTDVEPFLRVAGRGAGGPGSREATGRLNHDRRARNPDVPARLLRHRVRDQSLDEPPAARRPRGGSCPVAATCSSSMEQAGAAV